MSCARCLAADARARISATRRAVSTTFSLAVSTSCTGDWPLDVARTPSKPARTVRSRGAVPADVELSGGEGTGEAGPVREGSDRTDSKDSGETAAPDRGSARAEPPPRGECVGVSAGEVTSKRRGTA